MGGVAALGLFFLVKKGWFGLCVTGFSLVVLLWLGVGMLMTGQLLVGCAASLFALAGLALFVLKSRLPRSFLNPCLGAFFAVFGLAALVTAVLPEAYQSTSRIMLRPDGKTPAPPSGIPSSFYDPFLVQTEFEVMQSSQILGTVIKDLDLGREWGKLYGRGEKLEEAQVLDLLRARLALHPVRNTSLIEVMVYGPTADEPARIANKIAEVYQRYRRGSEGGTNTASGFQVEILDRAVPGPRPVRPNKPANLAIGALAGMLLGIAAGAARIGGKGRREEEPH